MAGILSGTSTCGCTATHIKKNIVGFQTQLQLFKGTKKPFKICCLRGLTRWHPNVIRILYSVWLESTEFTGGMSESVPSLEPIS